MIGKLLSNSFKPHDAHTASLAPLPPSSSYYTHSLRPLTNDKSSVISVESKPPISVIDEADTLNLLYGSTNPQPTVLADVDPARDIRVVVITDITHLEHAFFDTQYTVEHTNPSQSKQASSWFSADIPSFHALQDRVFGSSQIKYNGPVTKLHPFPLAADSTSHKWLVSRLFRLEQKLPRKLSSTKVSSTKVSTTVGTYPNPAYPASHHARLSDVSENDNVAAGAAGSMSPKVADYTCAICVFISSGSDSYSCITNYWNELSAALLQLQQAITARLVEQLPMAYRDFQRDPSRNYHCFSLDEEIKHSVDTFKHRFLDAVRIPRVICGQKRWSELLGELRWADSHFEKSFLPKLITTFIKYNSHLLATTGCSTSLGQILTRTVIVGDRIATRRLIFILAALIHSSNFTDGNQTPFTNRFHNTRRMEFPDDSDEDDTPLRSASTSSLCNQNLLPVQGGVGWEIPTSGEAPVAESHSICTMSHVIRPAFAACSLSSSSSGTSLAAASRLANATPNNTSFQHVAVNVFRKAAALSNSFTPSSFGNSFSWQKRQVRANSVASVASVTSVDDVMFHSPAIDERLLNDYEYFSEAPPAARVNTQPPRTLAPATKPTGGLATLTPNSRSNSFESHSSSHSSSMAMSLLMDLSSGSGRSNSSTCTSACSTSYESVAIPSKSAVCLDVPAIDEYDGLFEEIGDIPDQWAGYSKEIYHPPFLVTPVAGFIGKFHADFVVQGCPVSRDLESQIARAVTAEGLEDVHALIVDEDKSDIHILDSMGRRTESKVTKEDVGKVSHILEQILREGESEMVRKVYEQRFDIL